MRSFKMADIYGSLSLGQGMFISPGIKISLDDKIHIHRYFVDKTTLNYADVNKVIYMKCFLLIKFFAPQITFTMSSFMNRRFVKELKQHGVLCEKYNKEFHSPEKSSMKFWLGN